jgi:hypothetical protein
MGLLGVYEMRLYRVPDSHWANITGARYGATQD